MEKNKSTTGLEIAVIGMAGRFPGAGNIPEFWENLRKGIESISFRTHGPDSEVFSPENTGHHRHYISSKGVLEGKEYFDASFFGYTPNEAELMDPQVRIFHECAWEALEDAGYNSDQFSGLIGLYAGASVNFHWEARSVLSEQGQFLGRFAASQLTNKDFLSTRISYKLNLKGPSYALYTACSTSLVAVHVACRALLTGECDIALAGGVSISPWNDDPDLYQGELIRSSDGHCRAFDARAEGTIPGEGVGAVVLRRLKHALTSGDHVHAVIKGSATNNDGCRKVGFSAPSIEGQAEVIKAALRLAAVEPETIRYVETHGTGTLLGDPIEVEGLKMAFAGDQRRLCGIGSVKTNIGHLDSAAGVAALIKLVLMLKHRQMPPSLHYENPNPKIDFKNTPFYVNTVLREWAGDGCPLRGGVSSFGIGGTNAHVVLEEFADTPECSERPAPDHYQLILFSARTEAALSAMEKNLLNHFTNHRDISLADMAYTLQLGRKHFLHRKMLVGKNSGEIIDILSSKASGDCRQAVVERENPQVAFMFPGQGSQYLDMGSDLYRNLEPFRLEMDRGFDILNPIAGHDMRKILYPGGTGDGGKEPSENGNYKADEGTSFGGAMYRTEFVQPLLFLIEYSLARLLMQMGVRPYAMIGHSIGEYVAACLSGVLSLSDALFLVVQRGRLMARMPAGAMMGIAVSAEELRPLLPAGISLAAENGPSACVVSGEKKAIGDFAGQVKKKGYDTRSLHTRHAFHSSMMDPVLEAFHSQVKKISLREPTIPYMSNVTGTWMSREDAVDPEYWTRHLRQTVRFSDNVRELLENEGLILLEVGPGTVLGGLVREQAGSHSKRVVLDTIRGPKVAVSDYYYFVSKIGQLWLHGQQIDWNVLHSPGSRRRVPLPTYPFQRKRFWIETDPRRILKEALPGETRSIKQSEIDNWFYQPAWEISPPSLAESPAPLAAGPWIILPDDRGLGEQLARRLADDGQRVVKVAIGSKFQKQGEDLFTIAPTRYDDYLKLFENLDFEKSTPLHLIHLWSLGNGHRNRFRWSSYKRGVDLGYHSLIYLAQAIGKQRESIKVYINVVTNNMQPVAAADICRPEMATVLGPVKVIPREYPNIDCRSIDIDLVKSPGWPGPNLVERLLREFRFESRAAAVAYRNDDRLVQVFKPLCLDKGKLRGDNPSRLKQAGVYLIIGGLGGIGFSIAEYLAQTVKARLILIGRSPFPERREWERWPKPTADNTDRDDIDGKIQKIKEFEKKGAEVHIFQADISRLAQMQPIMTRIRDRFGRLDGIIHAAGIPESEPIQTRTYAMSEDLFSAKIEGVRVLDQLLEQQELDFFILCSSISGLAAPVGQVAYAAANAFLDAYAHYRNNSTPGLWVSIDWGGWQEVGMAARGVAPQVSLDHPLLDYRYKADSSVEVYVSHLNIDRHWVLAEHRLPGAGVLPGTAYLEILRAAFDRQAGGGGIEIQDLTFLAPLLVGENEDREVRLLLKKNHDAFEFSFLSRSAAHRDRWLEHARGNIAPLEQATLLKFDIEELRSRCSAGERDKQGDPFLSSAGALQYGPRWGSVKSINRDGDRGLARLELPEQFKTDLETYSLHPALLDTAVGFLPSGVIKAAAYSPFIYRKIRINGPLPRKLYSYAVCDGDGRAQPETMTFQVKVMSGDGRVIVDVEDYILKRVMGDHTRINSLSGAAMQTKSNGRPPNFFLDIASPGLLDTLDFQPSPRRAPEPAEVEVEVRAAGLNFRDVLLALGMLSLSPGESRPFGFECAGVIVSLGEEVKEFQLGDEVIVFARGSFGRFITVPVVGIVHKPAHLSMQEAATIPVAFLTAYYSLVKLARLSPQETVLIHSASGGVGLAAVEVARWIGARIFATAGNDEKREFLRSRGISQVMDSRSLSFAEEVMKITGNSGVDVILNSLAGEFIARGLSVLAPYGRFLEIGTRDISENRQLELQPFSRGLAFFAILVGHAIPGFRSIFTQLIQHFTQRRFSPLPYRLFPRHQVIDAFEFMAQAKHIGKIVLDFGSPAAEKTDTLLINNERESQETHPFSHFLSLRQDSAGHHQFSNQFRNDLLWEKGILPCRGVEAFARVLGEDLSQVIVFPGDFPRSLEKSSPADSRPDLTTPFAAPRNPVEQKLVDIWQRLFGYDRLGIHDDFFELGGHSLKATILISRINKEFDVKLTLDEIFGGPTVKDLAERIVEAGNAPFKELENVEEREYFELSFGQKRLWYINQLEPESTAYHISGSILLNHEVNIEALKRALHLISDRHDSLRTGFKIVQDEPVQFILKTVDIPCLYLDISTSAAEEKSRERDSILFRETSRVFDLNRPPLFRTVLIKLGRREYELVFNMHHIITDGWSLEILKEEFHRLYDGLRTHGEILWKPRRFQYKDFAAWNNKRLKQPELKDSSHRFWREKLAGGFPITALPADSIEGKENRRGAGFRHVINRELKEKTVQLAADRKTSLFMLMFSAFNLFLYRFSGEKRIGCSIIASGREHLSLNELVGFFVNSVAVGVQLDPEESFLDFLDRLNRHMMEILRHQDYPLELVFEELGMRYPDIPVSFNMLNIQDRTAGETISNSTSYHLDAAADVKFDLEPYIVDYEDGIDMYWSYKKSIFRPETVSYMVKEYVRILDFFVGKPHLSYREFQNAGKIKSFRKKQPDESVGKRRVPGC